MNTFTYLKDKSGDLNSGTTLLSLIVATMLLLGFTMKPVFASSEINKNLVPEKVDNILIETEKAIASLRIDPSMSLTSINLAIDAIKQLEKTYEHKVITKTKEKYNTEIAKGYEHYYPPLSDHIVSNINALPTLSYKVNSNILYRGQDVDDNKLTNAYLDYTFAKASLMTAKDAINDNDALEAIANLRRVFEAVYLTPDFNVKS